MELGKLIKWDDAKGFGFIQIEGNQNNIFIHISTLKHMSRAPKVGDCIYFETRKQSDGKLRAENCRIQGVKVKEVASSNKSRPKNYMRSKKRNRLKEFIFLILLLAIVRVLFEVKTNYDDKTLPVKHEIQEVEREQIKIESIFKCEGKQHCSQMSSCEEAKYYIQNCPSTKMDGDGDGIPCERQHCSNRSW